MQTTTMEFIGRSDPSMKEAEEILSYERELVIRAHRHLLDLDLCCASRHLGDRGYYGTAPASAFRAWSVPC